MAIFDSFFGGGVGGIGGAGLGGLAGAVAGFLSPMPGGLLLGGALGAMGGGMLGATVGSTKTVSGAMKGGILGSLLLGGFALAAGLLMGMGGWVIPLVLGAMVVGGAGGAVIGGLKGLFSSDDAPQAQAGQAQQPGLFSSLAQSILPPLLTPTRGHGQDQGPTP